MFKRFADWLTDLLYKPGKKKWFIGPAVFLTFLSPVLLLASFSYVRTNQDLTNFTLSRRQTIAYLAATTLKEKFNRLTDVGISLATRVRFRQLISEGKWDEAIEILRSVPTDFPVIDRIFLTDPGGTLKVDAPKLPGVREKNFAFRDWYQGVSSKWEPYVSEVYKRAAAPQYNVIAIAVPIKDEKQKILGLLVLQVRLDAMFDWSKNIEVGPSGFVYFVDRGGHVVAHPKVPPQGEIVDHSSVPAVQKVRRGERGVEVLFNPIENEERVSAYEPVPGYGWGVIVQQPKSSAFAARDNQLVRIFFAYSLICLFSATLAYLGLRTIITHKKAEEKIKKLNEDLERRAVELEAANKELEAFSYSVSHDLRAPLRSIDGFSQALMEDYGEKVDGQGKDYLVRVRTACQRMGQLIDDLLNLSRVARQEMRRDTVNLSALAKTITAELKNASPIRQVEFVIAEGLVAKGDERLLRLALENLLGNAWKFTGKHPRARIEFGTEQMDGRQAYYVRDDGVGFDMAYLDKLFGAFQRLHGRTDFPGTGIGLATVQRIIHRHGGRVWAKGRKGQGATFYFTI